MIRRSKALRLSAILAFSAGFFVLDLCLPLGVPGGIWYVIPLLLTAYVGARFLPLLLAGGLSALTVAGYILTPTHIDPGLALFSRSVGIGVLWIVAGVVSERNRAEQEHARTMRQLAETNENLTALTKITTNAIGTLDLDALLAVLLNRLVEVMQADAAVISLRKDEQLMVRASVGVEAAVQAKYSVPIGKGFTGTIAQTLQPLYIADAQNDARVESPFIKQRGIRTMLGVPMRRDGDLVGVIHVDWLEVHPQREQEVHLLEITAERCALAILNAQLYENLKRSEERYQRLIELSPDAIIVYRDNQHVFINTAGLRLLGATRPDQVLGRSHVDFVHPDYHGAVANSIRQALEEGKATLAIEVKAVRLDGKLVDVEVAGMPFADEEGQAILVILRDITERKRAEAHLRLQSAALEAAANAIVITNRAGIALWVNGAFTRLTGYAAAEVVGQNLRLLKSGKHDPAFYENLWKTILAGRVWQSEMINRHQDGHLYTEESTITPVHNEHGVITHFITVKQDISVRKLTEARLQDSEALYHSLVENLPQHVFRKDLAGRFTFANGPFCQSLGRPPAAILGKTDFDFFPTKLASTYRADDQQVIETGQSSEGEEAHQQGDGKTIFVNVIKMPLRDATGRIIGVQGISWDITERRQLEQQLRQAQKMEAIGQLAGGVAHDFNNVLAVIHGNAELLLMEADQLSPPVIEGLKQIGAATERAAHLTRQLLAFSRKQVIKPEALNLNGVIDDLAKMLKRIIGESIQLQSTCAPGLPFVLADIGMMEQVIVNLVVNARDAMPGGGQLLLSTEPFPLDETGVGNHPRGRPGQFVCLSVRDTGTGIAPEHLPHIFEPFFTTKEPGKGTGLGLATVYGIVDQHEGWIEVSSKAEVGTTFKIFLPATEPPVTRAAELQNDLKPRGGSETLLLVEDDQSVRLLTRRLLESFGYRVLAAGSGPEALEIWKRHGPEIDLLLTDIVLPGGVTGRELAEQLRAQGPGLGIIFTSGYSLDVAGKDTEFIRRTQGHFLQKPCPSRVLLAAVRRCLDEKS